MHCGGSTPNPLDSLIKKVPNRRRYAHLIKSCAQVVPDYPENLELLTQRQAPNFSDTYGGILQLFGFNARSKFPRFGTTMSGGTGEIKLRLQVGRSDLRDFAGVSDFGISVMTAADFLRNPTVS